MGAGVARQCSRNRCLGPLHSVDSPSWRPRPSKSSELQERPGHRPNPGFPCPSQPRGAEPRRHHQRRLLRRRGRPGPGPPRVRATREGDWPCGRGHAEALPRPRHPRRGVPGAEPVGASSRLLPRLRARSGRGPKGAFIPIGGLTSGFPHQGSGERGPWVRCGQTMFTKQVFRPVTVWSPHRGRRGGAGRATRRKTWSRGRSEVLCPTA